MTNPAAAARAKVLADWPGASVVARGRHSITLENPLNPNQKRVITQAGGALHIRNSSTEIDTAWAVGDSTPYRRKMELADFHAYAGLNDLLEFDAGQIVKYVHPASGAEITFQPADLNWTNDIDQIEPVGSVQGVAGSLSDDTINWAGAYGPGLDFSWTAQTTRLQKLLTIQNAAAIGTPPQFIIDGGNPVLALNLQIQYSNDIRIFADGVEWNQKNNTEIDTASRVEFRAADGVTVLWFFEPGWVYDPNRPWPADWETNPDQSFTRHENVVTQVRNRANTFYVQVRVPWAFLEASTFPVHVDPSVSDDISASAHDVWWAGSDSTIDSYNMGDILIYIVSGNSSQIRNGGFYFDIDTTIKGDTIDTASISSPGVYDSDMDSTIYCDDRDSPGVFYNGETTSSIDAARTTASATWEDSTWSSDEASADFASAVQEVTDRAGWTGGMRVYAYGGGTPSDSAACYSYDWSAGSAVTLDITYTAAGTSYPVDNTVGSYSVTGQSLTVTKSLLAGLTTGSFAITGNTITASIAYSVSLTTGTLSIVGHDIEAVINRGSTLTTGSYALSGADLTVAVDRPAELTLGTFAVAGQSLTASLERGAALTTGTVDITGLDITTVINRGVTVTTGSYTISGQTIEATVSTGGVSYPVDFTLGNLTVSGLDATAVINRAVEFTAGSYALSGNAADVAVSRPAALTLGNLTITGQSVTVVLSRLAALTAGSYTLTGQTIETVLSRPATLTTGALVVTGQDIDATVTTGGTAYPVDNTLGSYTIVGYALAIVLTRAVSFTAGGYTMTGRDISASVSVFGVEAPTKRTHNVYDEDRTAEITDEDRVHVIDNDSRTIMIS